MFKILVIDEDVISNKKLEQFVKDKEIFQLTVVSSIENAMNLILPPVNSLSSSSVVPAPEIKENSVEPSVLSPELSTKLKEEGLKPQLIFVDISKIGSTPLKWHTDFRENLKLSGNENVPIILLSVSGDPLFIRGFLATGVHDVFVKPVVSTIFEDCLNYFLNGEKGPARKVLPIKGVVEMLYPAIANEISEFDMKISSLKSVELNDFKPIYGDFFKWSVNRRVMARCTDCQEDKENKGSFLETFSFVGVPPLITKEIRVWLRNYYVAKKQNASS